MPPGVLDPTAIHMGYFKQIGWLNQNYSHTQNTAKLWGLDVYCTTPGIIFGKDAH
jgi:hypothetical protein